MGFQGLGFKGGLPRSGRNSQQLVVVIVANSWNLCVFFWGFVCLKEIVGCFLLPQKGPQLKDLTRAEFLGSLSPVVSQTRV